MTIAIPAATLRRFVIGAVAVLILIAALFLLWQERDRITTVFDRGLGSQVDKATYQAVFLVGGQVYFGVLSSAGEGYVHLRDVFYLSQGEEDAEGQGQLVKRGTELHAPEDPMIIPVAQVLFVENMRSDSEIVAAIRGFLSGDLPARTAAPRTSPVPTSTP